MTETQRFPAPWRIVDMSDHFAVQDATGHSVAFFHFPNRPDAAPTGGYVVRDANGQALVYI